MAIKFGKTTYVQAINVAEQILANVILSTKISQSTYLTRLGLG